MLGIWTRGRRFEMHRRIHIAGKSRHKTTACDLLRLHRVKFDKIPNSKLRLCTYSSSVARFGKSLQVFGKFLTVYLLIGKMLSLLYQICDIIGLIFFVANGQILKNNLTIWSHCARCFSSVNISSCPKECNQELEVYRYIVYYITFFVPNCKTLFLNMGHYIMKLHKLKSVYVVLGNRTWCHLLVSTKGSSQLWRPPLCKPLLPSLTFL